MFIQDVADKLNGCQYGDVTTVEYDAILKEHGIVVVFGYSDDLAELRGAIYDEVGGTIYLKDGKLLRSECDDTDCPYFQRELETARTIEPIWCGDNGWDWSYETDIPHATFEIYEDEDKYCLGIVFKLDDIFNEEQ